jgi:hypothetical protein
MTLFFDTIALAVQLSGAAAILYGAVLSLEIDVLADRILRLRRAALLTTQAA